MLIRRLLQLASLLGLGLVTACTTTSNGDPRPADNTASSSAPQTSGNGEEELPFAGAPKVTDPLNTSRYEQDPCQSLTADQAQSQNLPPTGTINDEVALSKACEWRNPTTRGYVQISFIVDDPRGLSPEYDANNRGKLAYFDVLPNIEGFPAVARDITDDRENGYCSVAVGVADDMVFDSNVQLSQANIGHKDPCEIASDIARLALQTMKQGA